MAVAFDYKGDLTCAMEVSDLERSIAWYAEHLGFELIYKLDDYGWCEMQSPVPGVSVGLSQVEKPTVKGGACLTWGVTDIDKSRQALESQNVKFDGDTTTIEGMVKLAGFFDPDGNKMMFAQSLTEMSAL